MSEIVPFGKYKGQPVEAMQADQTYVEWLRPSLVRATLCGIHQLIVAEPFETPEHNRLQMRFLDDEFCWNQPSASFAELGQTRRESSITVCFTLGKASWSMPQINASRA